MNSFPQSRRPDSIEFLLETVLRSLDEIQIPRVVTNGSVPDQSQPVSDSGVEYDFRYLHGSV